MGKSRVYKKWLDRLGQSIENLVEIKANDTLQFGNSEFILTCSDVSIGKESRIDSPETQSMPANRPIGIGAIIENTYRITAMLGKGVLGTFF